MSEFSPKSPTTRHVLHTLGAHMDLNGGSCFPSAETIAKETALHKRAVYEHIGKAIKEGWVKKFNSRIYKDQRWKKTPISCYSRENNKGNA